MAVRPTQKLIAQQAGTTQATVSLALRDDPSISKSTRQRIQAVAKALGYRPDPLLSALASYRKRSMQPSFKGTIAWLWSRAADGSCWKDSPTFLLYHKGAVKRADELGYRIEAHAFAPHALSGKRLEQILRMRGINGILIAPQPVPESKLDFCFDTFSSITYGYTLSSPRLNLVALSQFRSTEQAFRRLLALGYRRPGLAVSDYSDRRAARNWSAAFWSQQRYLPAKDRVPLLISNPFTRQTFAKWFHRYRPDAVLSIDPGVLGWLQELGQAVPVDCGFAMLSVPDNRKDISGIWENPEVIGEKSVELLIDMMHRGVTGVPEPSICFLVEGTWNEGATLRSGQP